MKRAVISIGSYDGIHQGHKAIIDKIKEISLNKNISSAIFFFKTPPKLYLTNNITNSLITLPTERKEIIKSLGIDNVISIEFNDKIHTMEPEEFFEKYILSHYFIEDIVVGKDFAVGYRRKGNLEWLYNFASEKGFSVHHVDYVKYENKRVSSSLIREMLKNGEVDVANIVLTRPYFLNGIVKKGAGIGRKIGYPTANIEVDVRKILPPGIFVVSVELNQKKFNAVASVGRRPTLKTLGGELICEVHILDFDRDIYGESIKVSFLSRIREEKKFEGMNELKQQIKNDIEFARNFFFSFKNN